MRRRRTSLELLALRGLEPTALAVQVGPTTVAVGAGDYLYVFDLADPAP